MVVINNIDRNYKKEAKRIEDIGSGGLFEFRNELYVKGTSCTSCTSCINISRGNLRTLQWGTVVFKVVDCEIEYSLIKDKKEATIIPEREYQKYEFCKAKPCSFLMSGGCSTTGCLYTAKEFHEWICANSFRIIKANKKED